MVLLNVAHDPEPECSLGQGEEKSRMSQDADDYLAQLDRALEHIEATNVDEQLARENAPHLLAANGSAREKAPNPTTTMGDTDKTELAVSLLQTDVDVSISSQRTVLEDEPTDGDSGLATIIMDASGERPRVRMDPSPSIVPQRHREDCLVTSAASVESPVRAGRRPPPQPPELKLESQEIDLRMLPPGASHSHAKPAQAISEQSLAASSMRGGSRVRGMASRRGILFEHWPANLVFAVSISIWLALGPAYFSTQAWLGERSHAALAGLQGQAPDRAAVPSSPRAEGWSQSLLADANASKARFWWRWGVFACGFTLLLALPYRKARSSRAATRD